MIRTPFSLGLLLAAAIQTGATDIKTGDRWPQFLGNRGLSDASFQTIPTHFGPEENLLWKIEPPTGHASPVIWGDRLFLSGYRNITRVMVAIDRHDGSTIWEKAVQSHGEEDFTHRLASPAESTPCTTPVATKDLLLFAAWSGNSAGSRDKLEAHFDDDLKITDEEMHDPELFFKRFDKDHDGAISKVEMPESRARDVFKWLDRNNNQLWETDEFSLLTRPNGRGRNLMVAIRPGGADILNDTDYMAWEWRKNLPYVATPLVSEDRVYLVKSMGIVTCLDTDTGKPFFQSQRTGVKGEYFSSPIKAGNKIVLASNQGSLFVIEDGTDFNVLAHNTINEEIIASPAVVDNTLYIRSINSLWAFKENTLP